MTGRSSFLYPHAPRSPWSEPRHFKIHKQASTVSIVLSRLKQSVHCLCWNDTSGGKHLILEMPSIMMQMPTKSTIDQNIDTQAQKSSLRGIPAFLMVELWRNLQSVSSVPSPSSTSTCHASAPYIITVTL